MSCVDPFHRSFCKKGWWSIAVSKRQLDFTVTSREIRFRYNVQMFRKKLDADQVTPTRLTSTMPVSGPVPPATFYSLRHATPEPLPVSNPDTPTHNRLATSMPFSSMGGYYVETAFVEAAKEVKGKFVVVSPQNFLNKHLPDHPEGMPTRGRTAFRKVAQKKLETEMYEPLVCSFYYVAWIPS